MKWIILLLVCYLRPMMSHLICFHVNEFNYRGSTKAVYDYAVGARDILKHRVAILHPQFPRTTMAMDLFENTFPDSMYSYQVDPLEWVASEHEKFSIGGTYFASLAEKLKCEALYILKHGIRLSPPTYPRSFDFDIPTVVHAVFDFEFHDPAMMITLNKHLRNDVPSLPHIVHPPPPVNKKLINAITAYRSLLQLPETALVVCSLGGPDSFDSPIAQAAVTQLALSFSKEELVFLFAGTQPSFLNLHDKSTDLLAFRDIGIYVLKPIVEDATKESFFGVCDAMLHARTNGETFGMAIAEFSVRNKPVLTAASDTYELQCEAEHTRILGEKGLYYRSSEDIVAIISEFVRNGIPAKNYNAYSAFAPELVMEQFNNLILQPLLFGKTRRSYNKTASTDETDIQQESSLSVENINISDRRKRAKFPCKSPFCDVPCSDESACHTPSALAACEEYIAAYQPPESLTCPVKMHITNFEASQRRSPSEYYASIEFIPIGFAVPEDDILSCIPIKVDEFSAIDPANRSTYIYGTGDEFAYRRNMAHSLYGYTNKKAGWDALRHYEIMAAGSLPYFADLHNAPTKVMPFLPRELLHRGRQIADAAQCLYDSLNRTWTFYESKFNVPEYMKVGCCVRKFAETYLTSKALAQYMLKSSGNSDASTVLILLTQQPTLSFDYLAYAIIHGFDALLGSEMVVHYPTDDLITEVPPYRQPFEQISKRSVWGQGYTWAHRLKTNLVYENDAVEGVSESDVVAGIRERRWDVVIYAQFHRGSPLWDEVVEHYPKEAILVVDGEDYPISAYPILDAMSLQPMQWPPFNRNWRAMMTHATVFKRELEDSCPIL